MASLASTLTASEIIEHYRPTWPVNVSFKSNWGNSVSFEEPSWRIVAFSAIKKLEGQESKVIPGLGDFRVSDKAAKALRAYLLAIGESSLPFPRIAPASGGAILLVWTSGNRSIEIASFPDGEVVLEALEGLSVVEKLNEVGQAIRWLVAG